MNEVLEEIPRVRKELGYPPLVTPTSQIVGTQAVLNVVTGQRYQTITNEVKHYLQGRYGKAPGSVSPQVRHMAIGNEDVIDVRPADLLKPELDNLRQEVGDVAQSEEDVLIYAMFPDIGLDFLRQRAAGTLEPEALEPPVSENSTHTAAATDFNITFHGETYNIKITGTGHHSQDKRPYFVRIDGQPEEIVVEPLEEIELDSEGHATSRAHAAHTEKRPRATAPGHVTTSMPGTIVDVLVSVGDKVKAGDAVIITEAMKMETELQAPIAGEIKAIYVTKGDSVTPDETLIEIS